MRNGTDAGFSRVMGASQSNGMFVNRRRTRWHGDYWFALNNLVLKDFRVRYRNMSLGVFWSLLNPLIMMGLLTFVFTQVFPIDQKAFPVFVLCGLIPFNFFSLSWNSGTMSLLENTSLIKKAPVPRELIPLSSVLSNCLHLLIQLGLLLAVTFAFGFTVNRYWIWLPVIWALFILFVLGMVMASAALAIYIRDMRYIVESASLILFWLAPIFYPFSRIRPEHAGIYQMNPVAAMILALRNIVMDGQAPPGTLLLKLGIGSICIFVAGWFVFDRLKHRFYNYL